MRKAIVATIIGMLALVGSAAISTPAANADVVDAGMEAAFVAKINALRISKGLGTLAVHGELVSVGRNWAQQMANAGAISHNPNFPNQVTANWRKLGENVGRGGAVDVLFNAFVNSPAHYANLVDGAFNNVGVGVIIKSDGTIFTSHQFMQLAGGAPAPAPAAPKAAPAPRPAAAPKAAAAPGAAPRPGAYHCVFFINGSLQTVPGFTLAPGRYTHQNGGGGTTRVAGGVIEFVGGPLTGQAGKVEPNIVRLFNEARSRTVIDCSTKG